MVIDALKTIAGLTVLSLIAVPSMPAQTPNAKEVASSNGAIPALVDQAAKGFLKDTPQAVGLSIGVLKDGKTYTYNYGTVEKGKNKLPTANTLYPLASITKTFTGTLLAQAAIEKKLNLDDDVRRYLDGNYPNLEFQGHPIRLYDLVNHRSGLPFFLPDKPEALPGYDNEVIPWPTRIEKLLRNYTKADFFADLHKVKLEAIPGEKFRYSNAAAQLMGYILERVYGMPYEELIKEKITEPLKMVDTTITLEPLQRERWAKGYDEKGVLMPDSPDQLQAAAALKSTVTDMLKYVEWQVAEKDEAVKLSHKPTLTDHNYSVGLNWQMMRSGDVRLIWQEGNIPGFDSLCINLPELKMGLVIFANEADRSSSKRLTLMANEILRALDPKAVTLP
ncbi:MAG: serine hydrolase domain-containing protein [Terracidiphilus sp.]